MAGLRADFPSTSGFCINRSMMGPEERREKDLLCPNTPARVSIQWVPTPLQSSIPAGTPGPPLLWTRGAPDLLGCTFTAWWLRLTPGFPCRRGPPRLTLGGDFLLPAGSSGPAVPLWGGSRRKCGRCSPFPPILRGRGSDPTAQTRNPRLREINEAHDPQSQAHNSQSGSPGG